MWQQNNVRELTMIVTANPLRYKIVMKLLINQEVLVQTTPFFLENKLILMQQLMNIYQYKTAIVLLVVLTTFTKNPTGQLYECMEKWNVIKQIIKHLLQRAMEEV